MNPIEKYNISEDRILEIFEQINNELISCKTFYNIV